MIPPANILKYRRLAIGGICAAPGVLLLFVILAIPLSRYFAERSVMVEAETSVARITFAGDDTTWQFEAATVCTERMVPDMTLEETDGPCSVQIYEVAEKGRYGHTFSKGETVAVRLRHDGYLVLGLGDGAAAKAVVLVAAEDWSQTGALAFDGMLSLGEVPGTGTRAFLHKGRFEARERLPWQSATDVVKTGDFARGEAVLVKSRATRRNPCEAAVAGASCDAVVFGHITATSTDGAAMLHVMAVSRAGDPELHVSYAGGAEPRVIRPTWIDSVVTSPALLAVALIMSFVSNAIILMLEGYRLAREPSEERPADDGPLDAPKAPDPVIASPSVGKGTAS